MIRTNKQAQIHIQTSEHSYIERRFGILDVIYVAGTHGSQPLDLSNGKILFRSRNLLPTSDSRAPLISALLSHMSIKGLRALLFSMCLDISHSE